MRRFLRSIGALTAGAQPPRPEDASQAASDEEESLLPSKMPSVALGDFDSYLAPFVGDTPKLSLLLDYDGTLAPIAPRYSTPSKYIVCPLKGGCLGYLPVHEFTKR